jgi:hypothetical protein
MSDDTNTPETPEAETIAPVETELSDRQLRIL